MSQDKKLTNSYTINTDDNTAAMIETIAEHEQRKPRELLRLLLIPALRQRWAEIQRQEHPENTEPMQQAIFKN